MHDELSVLKLVTARLEAAGLAYMVTGSVALSLYAEPRMTRDVDLVVELGPSDTVRIVDAFGPEFDVDADRIRGAITARSMFKVIHTAAVVKLDIIVRKAGAYRETEFRRRRRSEIDGATMWSCPLRICCCRNSTGHATAVQSTAARCTKSDHGTTVPGLDVHPGVGDSPGLARAGS